MPDLRTPLRVLLLATALAMAASPTSAQTLTRASVSGSVATVAGDPVGGALVTLIPTGSGGSVEATTRPTGTFLLTAIEPGTYDIRVEAIGFRPLLVQSLTLGAGERASLPLTLNAAPPPVTTVDTLALSVSMSRRFQANGLRLGSFDLEALPVRAEDVASLVEASSAFGADLGSQGLPGDMTVTVVDGVPFYRASHPTARVESLPDRLLPRSFVSGFTAIQAPSDVEWSGSSGGFLVLGTRSGTRDGGVELDGSWSGSPLWSSAELEFATPSFQGFHAAGRGQITLSPGRSHLLVAADAFQHELPLAPRVTESLASELTALDGDLVASLVDPGIQSVSRYAGMARADIRAGAANRIFVRGNASLFRREFTGSGDLPASYLASPAEETIEFSTAIGMDFPRSRATSFFIRSGVSGSYRDFAPAVDGRPPAYVTSSGSSLGNATFGPGTSSRTDFVLVPGLRHQFGQDAVKVGLTVRVSSHDMAHAASASTDVFYSDADALTQGRGFLSATRSNEASFSTREFGLFGQLESRPNDRVRMALGARFDWEKLSLGDLDRNDLWLQATGLYNDSTANDGFPQFDLRGVFDWDPTGSGASQVQLVAGVRSGDVDPRVIHEAVAWDVGATSRRYGGTGLAWPALAPLPGTARPAISLLGPDLRPPRTLYGTLLVAQRLARATTISVSASSRRTDFLVRRRNLNRAADASAVDAYGRDVFGPLVKDGNLVFIRSGTGRRLSGFGDIWALDPDGWSEHAGVTAGIEHASGPLTVFGSFTYSKTTDNWIGASSRHVAAAVPPSLPESASDDGDWTSGTSDFDIRYRASASARLDVGSRLSLSAFYRFRSGLPFTPGYRGGVDANGDGSVRNDPAFVVETAEMFALADQRTCLRNQIGGFAVRNSCRGPDRHTIDAGIDVRLGRLGGREASLTIDGFNLIESSDGVVDDALLLVDPIQGLTTSMDGSSVTIPVSVNPSFGSVLYPTSPGRLLRIGVTVR